MKKINLLIFSAIFFSLVSQTVFAQSNPFNLLGWQFGPSDLNSWLRLAIGNPSQAEVPDSSLRFPDFIYYIVFPFIAIVSLLYGLLSEIRLFQSQNVKLVLAISMAAISLPSGWLVVFVFGAFSFLSWWAVAVFVFVFFIGIAMWGFNRGVGMKNELIDSVTRMGQLKQKTLELDAQFAKNPKSVGGITGYLKKKADLASDYKKELEKYEVLSTAASSGKT
jgi:hypothetical protein